MGKRDRPRTARRKDERKLRELVTAREKLAALAPGGSPERPIVVETAAVVELRAGDSRCVQCQGRMRIDSHRAETVGGELLRVVDARCLSCGTPRSLWFKIVPHLAN
jgi:hypothetical protein